MTRCSDDRGNTLVEMLLAVMLLGIVFIGVLSSMGTSALGAKAHRSQTDAHAVLLSAAERLKSPDEVAYMSNCSGDFTSYLNAIRAVPLPAAPGWTPSAITIPAGGVKYWNGSDFGATCNDGTEILRLQLVTIMVTSPDGIATETLSVVKRGTP
jgi:type II secretory pathway pseudopilin PulG